MLPNTFVHVVDVVMEKPLQVLFSMLTVSPIKMTCDELPCNLGDEFSSVHINEGGLITIRIEFFQG